MRPLRLTMTAFGPYAGSETVDFDGLTELGLFVVAGNNGSGKTTIFDALHYSLFGTLPGRRSSYVRLRSDHAAPGLECSVVLDFTAKGKMWRVERSPKQTRAKRRGDGFTQVESRAALYRLDDGVAIAQASKLGEVSQLCRELVGLSGPQFERVALLPQGEFSRVLSEGATDRRELLRALFSSEVFGDATTMLNERAAAATAADRNEFARLDATRDALAKGLEPVLDMALVIDGSPRRSESELVALIDSFRANSVSNLQRQVVELNDVALTATQAHQSAVALAERVQRRAQVHADLAQHERLQAQYERDVDRLTQARAAIPVASQARTAAVQQERLNSAQHQVHDLMRQADHALNSAGVDPLDMTAPELTVDAVQTAVERSTAMAGRLDQRRTHALRADDLDSAVKRLHADLRRRSNEIATIAEQMTVAQTQIRQATAELAHLAAAPDSAVTQTRLELATNELELRLELETVIQQSATNQELLAEQQRTVDALQASTDVAQQARTQAATAQLGADSAIEHLAECNRRRDAAESFAAASTRLAHLRVAHQRASTAADEQWDAFIAGTAARVAETLTNDDACPVCGSHEHPNPAQPRHGLVATEHDVTTARALADQAQQDLNDTQVIIETLRARDTDIASLQLHDLAELITSAKAAALAARSAADELYQQASRTERLATELIQAQDRLAELADQQRQRSEHQHHLQGALGDALDSPLADLRSLVQSLEQDCLTAATSAERQRTLQDQITQLDLTIETIGIEQIAAENRRTSVSDQLDERTAECSTANNELAAIDAELTSNSRTTNADNFEMRTRAVRHGRELLASLTTAVALRDDAIHGDRRAQLLLDEKLSQSQFNSAQSALDAFLEPSVIDQLHAQTSSFLTRRDQLDGQLRELQDVPETTPNVADLAHQAQLATAAHDDTNRKLITLSTTLDRCVTELHALADQRSARQNSDLETRRLERVAALVKGDNDRNTSLENWVLAAHLRDVVELANVRLARSTQQRFQLCVMSDGENKRGRWGLDLGVEDTVTGTQRPTAGLSGGELFQASLALALGLADAVMNQTAGVHIDALFIDEGFGSLDETSVERAIDLLDELRDRGAMVGVITHVPALLDALPRGITVVANADGQGSTIRQTRLAA